MSDITAIVTAYRRVEQTLVTLGKIQNCQPRPAEIIVHVDGDQKECADAIQKSFPDVQVLLSRENLGPGGGRNKLIASASHEFVASFDDDSYPLDGDYFARVATLFEQFPEAAIINAAVYHQNEVVMPDERCARWVADFSGGGCIYRRSAFLETTGYVALPVAYGMEEVDLALRLHACGKRVLWSPWLRVFHDTDLGRHASAGVTAGSIANLALLAFLRYPLLLLPIGAGQVLNRLRWLVIQRRFPGMLPGILQIPPHCWRHRKSRLPVSTNALRSYLALRRERSEKMSLI